MKIAKQVQIKIEGIFKYESKVNESIITHGIFRNIRFEGFKQCYISPRPKKYHNDYNVFFLFLVHELITQIGGRCLFSNKLPNKIVRTIFKLSIIGNNIISRCTRVLLNNNAQLIVHQIKDMFPV